MIHRADTIVEILCRRIDTDGPLPAIAVKEAGQFRWRTWHDLAGDIAQSVAVLLELGVRRGDRVAQLSENRYEWIVLDLAIQMAGGVHVPIHAPLTGPQVVWQVRHSGAKLLFVSGPVQAAKLAAPAADFPPEVVVVAYDDCPEPLAGRAVATLRQAQNRANLAPGIDVACQTRHSIAADSLATILYTSGTTGEPKGVMLTQGNLASNAGATMEAFGCDERQLRLNFLPLSHVFARTCDLYCWLVEGSRLALAESRETVVADCQALQPTCLNGVPYFFDKLYRALGERGAQSTPGALRALLGGAIARCCAGGAALPIHLFDFFQDQGVPLLQGYGLSESSPVITLSTVEHNRRGSSGRAIPGIEVRIAADGEILTRGPHVMSGYYENPSATAAVLSADGWLATGDLGQIDADGFLFITGRKKELLVTSGGKNIAPVFLESLLTQDPLILQALVVGDGRSYLSALIVPNLDVLGAELRSRGLAVTAPELSLRHPETLALYRERIDRQLAQVAPYEQVRRFTLLPRGFSIEAGELTPKLSLRRQEIGKHFAAEIEALYAPAERQNSVSQTAR
jgi:long-chain acyl-CoA synthetase